MAGRGVHFALSPEELGQLLAARSDEEVMTLVESIEEGWDRDFLAESDKAWNAIHRCLTDGSLLYDSGEYPLNHTICGGRQLIEGEDYTVSLVTPEQVKDVASALQALDKAWLKDRYFRLLKPDDYDAEIGEDDFEYTWESFEHVRELYIKAAAADRAVIFTVDA
jgi:hypothetical protein